MISIDHENLVVNAYLENVANTEKMSGKKDLIFEFCYNAENTSFKNSFDIP